MNKVITQFVILAMVGVALMSGATLTTAQDTPDDASPDDVPPDEAPTFPEPGSYTAYQDIAGFERTIRIYIPTSYPEAESPVPLVFALHGAGDRAVNFETYTAFNRLADDQGFIMLYPDAVDGLWNAGQSVPPVEADDIALIDEMIAFALESLNIDPARVYVTGFSMGGMMSYRVACEMQDKVAAVVAVGAPLPRFVRPLCDDAEPIPIAIIHGLDDAVVPADGDPLSYLSLRETLRFWVLKNDCVQKPDEELTLEISARDGESVLLERFTRCADDSEVSLYSVEGGAHRWFGSPFEVGTDRAGFRVTDTVIDFFNRHRMTLSSDDAVP